MKESLFFNRLVDKYVKAITFALKKIGLGLSPDECEKINEKNNEQYFRLASLAFYAIPLVVFVPSGVIIGLSIATPFIWVVLPIFFTTFFHGIFSSYFEYRIRLIEKGKDHGGRITNRAARNIMINSVVFTLLFTLIAIVGFGEMYGY